MTQATGSQAVPVGQSPSARHPLTQVRSRVEQPSHTVPWGHSESALQGEPVEPWQMPGHGQVRQNGMRQEPPLQSASE